MAIVVCGRHGNAAEDKRTTNAFRRRPAGPQA
jgi:hypothetical protein